MTRTLLSLILAVVFVNPLFAQSATLSLSLVLPDVIRPVRAPVTALVWRLSEPVPSSVHSFRVDGRDLTSRVTRHGREFVVELRGADALGPGTYRITGDVCAPRGACAISEATLTVLDPELQPPGAERDAGRLVRSILETAVRWLLGGGS